MNLWNPPKTKRYGSRIFYSTKLSNYANAVLIFDNELVFRKLVEREVTSISLAECSRISKVKSPGVLPIAEIGTKGTLATAINAAAVWPTIHSRASSI